MALGGELPDYPWDLMAPVSGARGRAPRRHRRPLDRLAGRPDARRRARGARRGHRRARLPADGGHRRSSATAIVDWFERRRGVTGLDDGERAADDRLEGARRPAAVPARARRGRRRRASAGRVPELRDGRRARRRHARWHPTTRPSGRQKTRLVWLNSPGNPDGRVLTIDELRAARRAGARARRRHRRRRVLRRARLGGRWADAPAPSLLDPRVIGDDRHDTLVIYSLSKQSNMAGYRAAFVAGCRTVDRAAHHRAQARRAHAAAPLQAAMVAALARRRARGRAEGALPRPSRPA